MWGQIISGVSRDAKTWAFYIKSFHFELWPNFFFLKNTLVPPQKTILLYEEVVCRLLDGASGTVGRGSGEQGSSPGSAPLQHLWLGKDLTSLSLLPYNGPYLIVLLTRINKMIHVPSR